MTEKREQSDPVAELIKAAEHVLTESERVRDSKSSARFRRALGSLTTAVNAAKQNRTA
ncbi:MAG: hypothetical protein KAV00_18555 [Phycisphaerae bacterium]|nr:hypothetical protein [Phycisphaerae bacterium]